MRALCLSLVLGLASLGWMTIAPAQARADSDHGLNKADNVQVQWRDRGWRDRGWVDRRYDGGVRRPGWWGNTNYYYPGYASYYYPYSAYTYYPGYSSYYYTPGYSYYTAPAYYYTTPGYYVSTPWFSLGF